MKILFETPIPLPVEEVRRGFDEKLFNFLKPAWMPSQLIRFDGCAPGDQVHLRVGPLGQAWESTITGQTDSEQGWSFTDEGKVLPWPLKRWHHHHRVDRVSPKDSLIVDDISFDCGTRVLSLLTWPMLWLVFSVRPNKYKSYFQGKKS